MSQYIHKEKNELSIQYGCGTHAPDNWQNFDVSPTLLLQRIPLLGSIITKTGPKFPDSVQFGDIVRGLPIKEQSCSTVYCSHVLEHLSLTDFRTALRNTHFYLRPGGTFRFVVPDLEHLVHTYIQSAEPNAAIQFMESSYLGLHHRSRGVTGILRSWFGNSKHLWMWDYKSLVKELENVGFDKIRRAQYGDSEHKVFNSVEQLGRWQNCLGIECIRPFR